MLWKKAKALPYNKVCDFCKFEYGCSRKAVVWDYGESPVFAPCADSALEEYFDIEAFAESLETEHKEEQK